MSCLVFCVLGLVKLNIGYLEVVVGIVGLIKMILCLKNKVLFVMLYYISLNLELCLD